MKPREYLTIYVSSLSAKFGSKILPSCGDIIVRMRRFVGKTEHRHGVRLAHCCVGMAYCLSQTVRQLRTRNVLGVYVGLVL